MKICSIDECESIAVRLGMCNKHYNRNRLGKNPWIRSQRDKSPEERFREKLLPIDPITGCIEWNGSFFENGYGKFRMWPKTVKAHRFAWELKNGPIQNGFLVCHQCDNSSCVNPDHLFLGTHLDNMVDMDTKGRRIIIRGEGHGKAKLTKDSVVEIRMRLACGESYQKIADDFGVSQTLILKIKTGERWKPSVLPVNDLPSLAIV